MHLYKKVNDKFFDSRLLKLVITKEPNEYLSNFTRNRHEKTFDVGFIFMKFKY